MDRLIAAAAWNEPQSLEQALLVENHQKDKIDWQQLDDFVIREGIRDDREILDFYKTIGRPLPE